MRLWALCLVVALLAGAGLRMCRLGHSLRVDEVESWAHAQKPAAQILADKTRLPHVSLLNRWSSEVLGNSESRLRFPYALYGILTLPLLFLLGRRLFDERVGALACLLLAFSVFHIRYSQEARYYAPMIFYALAGLYCMVCALGAASAGERAKSAAYWSGFALAHLLALSLHRFSVFPAALCGAFLLLIALRAIYRREFGSVGLAAAGAVAGAVLLSPQWGGWREFLLSETSLNRALPLRESFLRWHYQSPDSSIIWELLQAYSGGKVLGALFFAAAVAGCLAAGRGRWLRSLSLWAWIALPVAALFLVRSHTHFELRYFCFLLPVWLLLAAAGLVEGTDAVASRFGAQSSSLGRRIRWLLVCLILCLDVGALRAYYGLPKSRMREAFEHIGRRSLPGDAVMFFPAWDVLWYGYYPLPDGCRLFHPAMLQSRSPAFSPADLVRSHERLWLAVTWIEDPIRRSEFSDLKAAVEENYSLRQESRFRSSDANDDYQVLLFERKAGPLPALRGGAPRDSPPDRRSVPPPFFGKKIRLGLNLAETAASMTVSRKGFFRILQNVALARMSADGDAAKERTAAFCRDGCIALVWSGRGRFLGSRTGPSFEAGDVLYLPPRGYSVRSPGGSLLLLFSLPGGPAGTGGVRSSEGAVRSLARLRSADTKGAPRRESHPWIWRDGLEVSARRLQPGRGEEESPAPNGWLQRGYGIVLDGPVHVEDGARSHVMDFRPGDLYLYRRTPSETWAVSNRTPFESLELRVIEGFPRALPDLAMSSSTGKTGALWPPAILQ